jgi:hypothetical protein
MSTFELERINKYLLHKQHLTDDSKIDDIIQIADDLCGLHSTNLTTSYLSLFARSNTFFKIDLENELYIKRNLGRIRGMRRTLFIESKKMIPIVHAATSELINKSFEKYMEVRGIIRQDYQTISSQILKILKGKELSAAEIRAKLDSKLDVPGIIQIMCNNRLLIREKPIKDWKDRRNKYALFQEYFPNLNVTELSETEAIQKLIERYIKTYGPVTENDISWWSGLTKTKIREALNNLGIQIERIEISGLSGKYLLSSDNVKVLEKQKINQGCILNILPELDPYTMGYKERERYIDKKNYNNVFDKSGNATATILLNGETIGVWDTETQKKPLVKLLLFQPLEQELLSILHTQAIDIGNFFFDREVAIKECKSMTPLTERTAGGFMTPLKGC